MRSLIRYLMGRRLPDVAAVNVMRHPAGYVFQPALVTISETGEPSMEVGLPPDAQMHLEPGADPARLADALHTAMGRSGPLDTRTDVGQDRLAELMSPEAYAAYAPTLRRVLGVDGRASLWSRMDMISVRRRGDEFRLRPMQNAGRGGFVTRSESKPVALSVTSADNSLAEAMLRCFSSCD